MQSWQAVPAINHRLMENSDILREIKHSYRYGLKATSASIIFILCSNYDKLMPKESPEKLPIYYAVSYHNQSHRRRTIYGVLTTDNGSVELVVGAELDLHGLAKRLFDYMKATHPQQKGFVWGRKSPIRGYSGLEAFSDRPADGKPAYWKVEVLSHGKLKKLNELVLDL